MFCLQSHSLLKTKFVILLKVKALNSVVSATNNIIPPMKRRQLAPPSILGKALPDLYGNLARSAIMANGRAKVATITRVGGRKQMISWVDAPDDVYFVATEATRSVFWP